MYIFYICGSNKKQTSKSYQSLSIFVCKWVANIMILLIAIINLSIFLLIDTCSLLSWDCYDVHTIHSYYVMYAYVDMLFIRYHMLTCVNVRIHLVFIARKYDHRFLYALILKIDQCPQAVWP